MSFEFCKLSQKICKRLEIVSPFYLLKGGVKKIMWTTATENAFQKLKQAFTSTPILQHPDPEMLFSVEVVMSDSDVGAFLSQHFGATQNVYSRLLFKKAHPMRMKL